ncbi:hypothetical protein PFICI_09103 [Pestalotiopsis fici W106-1]|uniref:Uncharacterized protein n=1 Tax=Pestalotiopsis fici (strain W106-1 / CGMCC3.15140) TaxID=1229662 RepID=W3WZI8_PESFW|nr:uncharacterized protein PFICI_09103 [Pestalotiopsis fici W106-1]ETS79250.1 hypothetical protein PFICI_09103 [Pestalotiopsis fici W106-1]
MIAPDKNHLATEPVNAWADVQTTCSVGMRTMDEIDAAASLIELHGGWRNGTLSGMENDPALSRYMLERPPLSAYVPSMQSGPTSLSSRPRLSHPIDVASTCKKFSETYDVEGDPAKLMNAANDTPDLPNLPKYVEEPPSPPTVGHYSQIQQASLKPAPPKQAPPEPAPSAPASSAPASSAPASSAPAPSAPAPVAPTNSKRKNRSRKKNKQKTILEPSEDNQAQTSDEPSSTLGGTKTIVGNSRISQQAVAEAKTALGCNVGTKEDSTAEKSDGDGHLPSTNSCAVAFGEEMTMKNSHVLSLQQPADATGGKSAHAKNSPAEPQITDSSKSSEDIKDATASKIPIEVDDSGVSSCPNQEAEELVSGHQAFDNADDPANDHTKNRSSAGSSAIPKDVTSVVSETPISGADGKTPPRQIASPGAHDQRGLVNDQATLADDLEGYQLVKNKTKLKREKQAKHKEKPQAQRNLPEDNFGKNPTSTRDKAGSFTIKSARQGRALSGQGSRYSQKNQAAIAGTPLLNGTRHHVEALPGQAKSEPGAADTSSSGVKDETRRVTGGDQNDKDHVTKGIKPTYSAVTSHGTPLDKSQRKVPPSQGQKFLLKKPEKVQEKGEMQADDTESSARVTHITSLSSSTGELLDTSFSPSPLSKAETSIITEVQQLGPLHVHDKQALTETTPSIKPGPDNAHEDAVCDASQTREIETGRDCDINSRVQEPLNDIGKVQEPTPLHDQKPETVLDAPPLHPLTEVDQAILVKADSGQKAKESAILDQITPQPNDPESKDHYELSLYQTLGRERPLADQDQLLA